MARREREKEKTIYFVCRMYVKRARRKREIGREKKKRKRRERERETEFVEFTVLETLPDTAKSTCAR